MVTSTLLVLSMLAVPHSNPNPWREVRADDEVHVWARDVPESNIREVKASGIVEAPPERVLEVITDIDHFTDFMPYVVESRRVPHDEAMLEYVRINPPLVAQRDYTLMVNLEKDLEKGVFVRSWSTANHLGPAQRDDSVRLSVCDGSWTLKRLGDKRTEMTYWVHSDPAGAIPQWLAKRASTDSMPDVLEAVRRRALDPEWKR